MKIRFLNRDKILAIHDEMIARHGGSGGIRDEGLLESAIAMPQASYGGEWLHETTFDQAVAYLFHLIQNHPFVDGNKRVGLAAGLIFLEMNGIIIEVPDKELYDLTMSIASGKTTKPEIADFLRKHAAA